MKAAVLVGPGRMELIDLPVPVCGPDEVLVRMLGVGLCGTDVSVFRGDRPAPRSPWVLGHEGVGEVVGAGSRVGGLRPGQRVAIEPNYCCFGCGPCRKGLTSSCVNRLSLGLNVPGVLAEYVAVPAVFAHPVADRVGLTDLVCTEPLTVARVALRRAGIRPGDTCLVVGAGSQGLLVCLQLVESGIAPWVREPHEGRLGLAASLGARPLRGTTEPVDHVIETSGVPAGLAQALPHLAPGGRATLIGMSAAPLALTSRDIVYGQISLLGSLIYDHPRDFPDTVAELEKGHLQPHRVLSGEYSLEEAPNAFHSAATTPGKSWIRLAPTDV